MKHDIDNTARWNQYIKTVRELNERQSLQAYYSRYIFRKQTLCIVSGIEHKKTFKRTNNNVIKFQHYILSGKLA